ncbi:MAG: DUF1667 domain-containing protein [Bacillota bacterium]
MEKQVICIVCPMGCHVDISEDGNASEGYYTTGNKCIKGKEYAINELKNPTRILTSTVRIDSEKLKRLPVKTKSPIPKDKLFECMKEINRVRVKAPVRMGDVIIENLLGTGVDLVASRSLE